MNVYKGYKKTNLRTYEWDKWRVVYEKDGRLFYRFNNVWRGTFKEYCEEREVKKL
jgi:hypothetical protein